jgi:hypothetical protein
VLRDLYVKQRLSTPQIAEMYNAEPKSVNLALRRAGVTLRRKTTPLYCQEPGCTNRVKKIRHTNNGALYGTLCALHRYQHRVELGRDYRQKVKQSIVGGLTQAVDWVNRYDTDAAQGVKQESRLLEEAQTESAEDARRTGSVGEAE